jgi:predicted dehydrogenase
MSPSTSTTRGWNRREFLASTVLAVTARSVNSSAAEKHFRAAIIGHTGHGDYGHEHDLIFLNREGVETVGVADPDKQGCARAAARCGATRQYSDYEEMLRKERPHLVAVCPRWTDEHYAMAKAVIQAGAHLYIEKPFTENLLQADELLAIAKKDNLKTSVAHQMRLAPGMVALKQALAGGLIGDLVEIRAHGKQDHRAGGEDLIVLGTHLFDLMRLFAGDPLSCAATILEGGREATFADIKQATEKIGPILGDQVVAIFTFPNQVTATFQSNRKRQSAAGPWGVELVGTKRAVRVLADINPRILIGEHTRFSDQGAELRWLPWQDDPSLKSSPAEKTVGAANKRVTDDWLKAIRENRSPECSEENAMRALEMAHAVFASGLQHARVPFPLEKRSHPLEAI